MTLVDRLDAALYPGFSKQWDDELLRERLARVIHPDHRVLDVGAGAGIVAEMGFRGRAAHVSGIDLDPRELVRHPLRVGPDRSPAGGRETCGHFPRRSGGLQGQCPGDLSR